MHYWTSYAIVLMTGLIIGIGILIFIHRSWRDERFLKNLVENITISLLAIFLTLMAAEVFFAFFAQTDNLNFTLASKNWFARYWSVNSLGYRDIEWTPEKVEGKRKIIVLGDSLTAGYGIKDIEDRFANILGKKLGDDYVVMVVAENGSGTGDQIERIKAYPYKPDILILQYYINDIDDAARIKNVNYEAPKLYPWPSLRPLFRRSYALNFVYWQSVRVGPYYWQGDFISWIRKVYDDPDIWWLHQQELLTIYDGTVSEKIELIVVVFPALTDVEGTREITTKVIDLYRERGVSTLDVAEMIENMPPDSLVVSKLDSHPNKWLHQQVADRLYDMVTRLEMSEEVGK